MVSPRVIAFEDFDFSLSDKAFEDLSYASSDTNEDTPIKESNSTEPEDSNESMGMEVFSPEIFDGLPDYLEFSASVDGTEANATIKSVGKPTTVVQDYVESLMSELTELLAPKDTISSELPKNRSSHSKFNGEKELSTEGTDPTEEISDLSTEEAVRVAAACFIQFSAHTDGDGDPAMLIHPFKLSTLCAGGEDIKNIYLASILLTAAEKVNFQEYDCARNLLGECYNLSSRTGNPIQRVVHYFTGALHEKINRETSRQPTKFLPEKDTTTQTVIKAMLSAQPVQLVIQEKLPFLQLMQFTSIQTIIENVATAKKIHMIDLSIRHGLQWIILLQSLATRFECPIDYLKISAVGKSEEEINRTGRSMVSFAQTLNLFLIYKAMIVSDLKNLKEEMFEVEEDEVVGVYSSMDVNPMIVRPQTLDNIMTVIRRLRPCIMMVVDLDANHNSPCFIKHFTEALFFYSNYFDCLGNFMDMNDSLKLILEECFHSHGIKNIVVAEGSERVVRHVGINIWRPYFE